MPFHQRYCSCEWREVVRNSENTATSRLAESTSPPLHPRFFPTIKPPRTLESHLLLQERAAEFLYRLFQGELRGKKAWRVAEELIKSEPVPWSNQLTVDLIRAAKVLASAYNYEGLSFDCMLIGTGTNVSCQCG